MLSLPQVSALSVVFFCGSVVVKNMPGIFFFFLLNTELALLHPLCWQDLTGIWVSPAWLRGCAGSPPALWLVPRGHAGEQWERKLGGQLRTETGRALKQREAPGVSFSGIRKPLGIGSS